MALKAHLEEMKADGEQRRHPRRALRLETSGTLPEGEEANVTVHNLSAAGLLIETDLELKEGDALAIAMPDLGPVGAEIVWASGRLYGCAFEQALGEAALAAAQLRGETPLIASQPQGSEPAGERARTPYAGRDAGDPLGLKLNRLRRERGLTLAQVASALDVSKPTVWAWEKGKARPLPERLAAIAEVLGVAEEELADPVPGQAGSGLIEECRLRIAAELGTSPDNIRIMIEV